MKNFGKKSKKLPDFKNQQDSNNKEILLKFSTLISW